MFSLEAMAERNRRQSEGHIYIGPYMAEQNAKEAARRHFLGALWLGLLLVGVFAKVWLSI